MTAHQHSPAPPDATLDAAEVARFGRIAAEWWDPNGKFKPLHQLGPARMSFIRDRISDGLALSPDPATTRPFKGLRVLDIGCGGGLVAQPLARLGAEVTAIDPSPETIAAAESHARGQGLSIEYRAIRAETLLDEGATFDAVTCLEVVEHVPDVPAFLAVVEKLVRPGGVLVLSTLNRTLKSYLLAIVGAEYVLRWLPVGTHEWSKFVTPEELGRHVEALGLASVSTRGLVYEPLRDVWSLSKDTDVNYLLAAVKLPALETRLTA